MWIYQPPTARGREEKRRFIATFGQRERKREREEEIDYIPTLFFSFFLSVEKDSERGKFFCLFCAKYKFLTMLWRDERMAVFGTGFWVYLPYLARYLYSAALFSFSLLVWFLRYHTGWPVLTISGRHKLMCVEKISRLHFSTPIPLISAPAPVFNFEHWDSELLFSTLIDLWSQVERAEAIFLTPPSSAQCIEGWCLTCAPTKRMFEKQSNTS